MSSFTSTSVTTPARPDTGSVLLTHATSRSDTGTFAEAWTVVPESSVPSLSRSSQTVRPARAVSAPPREPLPHYVSREPFEFEGRDQRGRLTSLMESGRMMEQLGIEPLDPAHDRAMVCGSPQMLADFRALLDVRGFIAAPRIGVPGQYVFERAFVEK